MLRSHSPQTRVWFVLFLGAAGPGVMSLLGRPAEEVFTLQSGLELLRICIGGAISSLIALFVEKPRNPETQRTRAEDQ